MSWEESVLALFEDLEMQADGLYLDERDREVASLAEAGYAEIALSARLGAYEVESLAEAGYAEIALSARLGASLNRRLRLVLSDGGEIAGPLVRCGAGWLLLDAGSSSWLVQQDAVVLLEGLAPGAVPEIARPLTARLSVGSVLRRLARDGDSYVLLLRGGRQVEGELGRIGADFAVVRAGSTELAVPLTALVALRGRR